MRGKRTLFAAVAVASAAGLAAQTATLSGVETVVATQTNGMTAGGMAVDASGNVYLCEPYLNSVYKETLAGGVYTQISIGIGLNFPQGVAVDRTGNVYIADVDNNRVLKEAPSGFGYIQSVVADAATNGLKDPSGLAVEGDGNIYIVDSGNYRVLKETLSAGSYIPSVLPTSFISSFAGIAVDTEGDVFIANVNYGTLLKETPAAGSYTESVIPTPGGQGPLSVAVDGNGNIYVAMTIDVDEVLEESPTGSGYTQTVLQSGSTLEAGYPAGVAVDGSGNLYVDGDSSVTKEWATAPSSGGGGPATNTFYYDFTFGSGGSIGAPVVLTQGATGLDFTDAGLGTCTTNGTSHVYSAGDVCTVSVLFNPTAAGSRYGAIELEDNSANVIATEFLQATGVMPQLNFLPGTLHTIPTSAQPGLAGMAIDGYGDVYITDFAKNRILKETLSEGSYTESLIGSGLNQPLGVAVDGSGSVYIADSNNARVLKETWSGGQYVQSIVASSGLEFPVAVAVDGSGNVYIADFQADQVFKETLSAEGYTQSTVPTGGLRLPNGVGVDGSGNVYIADSGDRLLLKEMLAFGNYGETYVGSGFSSVQSVAVDGQGNVYIADSLGSQILKETPLGPNYAQSVVNDEFYPTDVAVDGSGNLYLSNDSHVEKLDFNDAPSLSFDTTALGSTSADSPQTVTLENAGNAALMFPITTFPLPGQENNPRISPNFTLATGGDSECPIVGPDGPPATLAPSASCQLLVNFAPEQIGSVSGSLVLTDNNLNSSAPTYATQTIALSGTSTQATPAVSIVSTASSIFLSSAVTFTAAVSSVAGTPTGTVSFFDGTTALATVPLGADATYTTSGLSTGQHSITAVYSGDANFTTAASSAWVVTVVDFTISLSSASGVSGTVSSVAGGQAAYPLVVTPVGGTALPGAVSLSVTGLPAGATAVFAPATVAAFSGATNVTLVVTLPGQSMASVEHRPSGRMAIVALGLLLLPFAGWFRKMARNWNRIVCLLLLAFAGAAIAVGAAGCNGGSTPPSPKSYTLTVTGSAGSLSHSTTVSLTVE